MSAPLHMTYLEIDDYKSEVLGLPPCSDSHWQRIVQWLGEHVTRLAE